MNETMMQVKQNNLDLGSQYQSSLNNALNFSWTSYLIDADLNFQNWVIELPSNISNTESVIWTPEIFDKG